MNHVRSKCLNKKVIVCMMLFICLYLVTGCSTIATGAKVPEDMRKIEKVISIPEKTKDELYVEVNSWFVETFNSADSVIEFQDKEAGKVMGKYVFSFADGMYMYNVKQTISVEIRDSRLRVLINDPYFMIAGDALSGVNSNKKYYPLNTQSGIEKCHERWNKLIKSLESYLSTESDW